MTRVLFVNHSAELGGGELAMADLLRHLPAGAALLLSSGPLEARLRAAEVEIAVIAAGGLLAVRRGDGWVRAARGAAGSVGLVGRLARRFRRVDLIYANSQKALIAAAPAALIARRPLIWHLHDILTDAHFGAAARRAAVLLSNIGATHVICNSQATADAYRAAGGRRPLTVIPNGIDPTTYLAVLASATGPARTLGVIGRLAPWKGQMVALDALARLPDHRLVLVGSALFGESAYEATLRDRAAAPDIAGRVEFRGFVSSVATAMAGIDIALHCSTAPEPFGRVIVEAMLAGRPVIATAAGGAREIVTDGIDGVLTPPGDAVALADAVAALTADPARARRLAQAGRQTALDRYALHEMAARTRAVIDAVAARRLP